MLETQYTLIAIAAGLAFLGLKRLLTPKSISTIPHGPLRFLVGDLLEFSKYDGRCEALERQVLKYGENGICTFSIGPRSTFVCLANPAAVEDVLLRRAREFDHSHYHKEVFEGIGKFLMVALPTDDVWRAHRRLLAPSMSNEYLKQVAPKLNQTTTNLINLWALKRQHLENQDISAPFDAAHDISLTTMDSIWSITFGESPENIPTAIGLVKLQPKPDVASTAHGIQVASFVSKSSKLCDSIRIVFEGVSQAAATGHAPTGYWFLHRQERFGGTFRYLQKYMREKLHSERDAISEGKVAVNEDKPKSVLELMVSREAVDGQWEDSHLIDELFVFALAGQDTTGGTLSFAIKYLSHAPAVQKRLRAELQSVFGLSPGPKAQELTYEEVQSGKSPYLEAVVAEILRLGNSGTFATREAYRDTELLGHFIPKGTQVICLVGLSTKLDTAEFSKQGSGVENDRKKTGFWTSDPTLFQPSRWLEPDSSSGGTGWKFNPKAGHSLPFGGGVRQCFGTKLAMLQVRLVIARLSSAFFFDLVDFGNNSTGSNVVEAGGEGGVYVGGDIPGGAGEWKRREAIATRPDNVYIRLRRWDDVSF